MELVRSMKYRLYPTKKQEELFNIFLQATGEVYNFLLTYCRNLLAFGLNLLGKYELAQVASRYCKGYPWMKQVASRCITEAAFHLHSSFENYALRQRMHLKGGKPRYKGKGRVDSFQYGNDGGFRFSKPSDNLGGGQYIRLGNIGFVKCRNPFKIPGKQKVATVYRKKEGRYYNWYVTITYVLENWEASKICLDHESKNAVGIDMGLESRLALSNGMMFGNDHAYEKYGKQLSQLHSRLINGKSDPMESEKIRSRLAHIYKKIRNKKKEDNIKLAIDLNTQYDLLCMEDLNVSEMIGKSRSTARKRLYMDAAWRTFIDILCYKAEEAGNEVIFVCPANTSQMCSRCGTIVKKDEAVRIHNCPVCGYVDDRDVNAANNILRLGLGLQTLVNNQKGDGLKPKRKHAGN